MNQPEEKVLFEKIKKSDVKSFETLFHFYYGYLCLYASKILKDKDASEEIVQDFFVKLWEKREHLTIESSVKNYLFRSVKNQCLNHIQHNKIKARYAEILLAEPERNSTMEENYLDVDMAAKIEESILLLPEKRREIFRLSREQGLKYREIAEKLNLSIKTVETQMSLAIKSLRNSLGKYKSFFTFIFLFSKK